MGSQNDGDDEGASQIGRNGVADRARVTVMTGVAARLAETGWLKEPE